jgi:hypothetical protein
MKNMERGKFEDSWKDALNGAEVTPSEQVWTSIELELEKAKGGQLKRRLMFYQLVAAASVIFAMVVGAVSVYYSKNSNVPTNHLADLTEENASAAALPSTVGDGGVKSRADESIASLPEPESTTPSIKGKASGTGGSNQDVKNIRGEEINHPVVAPGRADRKTGLSENRGEGPSSSLAYSDKLLLNTFQDRPVAPFYSPAKIHVDMKSHVQQVDPVIAMLARVEQREREVQGKEKSKKAEGTPSEKLWTSVGFAAGSFNTLQSSASASSPSFASSAAALTAPIVDQETKASGYSYSMGVNLGTKLSERWVLQGGVNYLTHSSEYTANNVVVTNSSFQQQRFRAASTNELINSNAQDLNNRIVYSAPYNVNNSMRYLSIPMQAGYLLVNKTFGLQLNAGVATDLFLQNTITADSDQLDKTSQSGGEDSPYRSVNLSGLFGTEVSYRFGQRYRVALNPGVRYPFNTIYKSELGVEGSPLTFDVGLRFRYILH